MLMVSATSVRAETASQTLRIYNPGSERQRIDLAGKEWLEPAEYVDAELAAPEALLLPKLSELLWFIERHAHEDGAEEHRLLTSRGEAACEAVAVSVPSSACRFGTAEASVPLIANATYTWSVERGAITSGQGTRSIQIVLGAASSVSVRVAVTAAGCTTEGVAVIPLVDPLQVTFHGTTQGRVGELFFISWSYNTTKPVLTQHLYLPGQAQPVRLASDVRSHGYVPAAEGSASVRLTAALYRLGARRRAVRSGSGPSRSDCSFTTAERQLDIRAACSDPRARVSGGGDACERTTIHASFSGTPPFSGRWSDGQTFTTSATELARTVTATGDYRITQFEDATCGGTASGHALVTIFGAPSASVSASWSPAGQERPPAIPVQRGPGFARTSLRYQYGNATACAFTSALGNAIVPSAPCAGSGSSSILFPSLADTAGEETSRSVWPVHAALPTLRSASSCATTLLISPRSGRRPSARGNR